VVLVSPRNPLNIGAVARAMANFGFSRLKIVAPYDPHWREAKSAVGAPEILSHAEVFDELSEAVRDCTLVAGTGTLTFRQPEQTVVQLPAFPSLVRNDLNRGGQVALVFGPEKHGLTRQDLSFCHVMIEIPTGEEQPSMNLGQAAAVCLYEVAMHSVAADDPANTGVETATHTRRAAAFGSRPAAASSASLELLAGLVEQVMEAARYSPPSMLEANRHDVRLLLRRLSPGEKDLRRMLGFFRRILWRLKGSNRESL